MNYFATGLDYFIKGGPVMYPLLLCSIAAIAITRQFCDYIEQDNWADAKALADSTRGEIAKLATVFMSRHGNYEKLENFVGIKAARAIDKFERRLDYLNVIVALAPVLGLLGTITGMISSFNNFSKRLDDPLVVTAGIGEALITTVFGLCISIVAICMYAYFNRRLTGITLNVEDIGNTLLEAIAKKLDKQAGGHDCGKYS